MKTTRWIHSVLIAMALYGSQAIGLSQNTPAPACPLGHEPGYGRSLTAEQRMAQRAVVLQLVGELKAKREAGTLTAEEAAWLNAMESRGGPCVTGSPREPGSGKGLGIAAGNGQRRGKRDGTGPRCAGSGCARECGAAPTAGQAVP